MNRIFNLIEITRKANDDGCYSKYLIYKDCHINFDKPNALEIGYNKCGLIDYIRNGYVDVECVSRNAEKIKSLGLIWDNCRGVGETYPIPLTCYWGRNSVILPISEKIVLEHYALDMKDIVAKNTLLRPNRIKNFSVRLPNQLSIELLEAILSGEKRRLNMCRIKQSKDTLTLETSISLLKQCKAIDAPFITLRDELTDGINPSDYHSAVITIYNYVLKRLKGKETSSC